MTRYFETIGLEAHGSELFPGLDCGLRFGSACLPDPPSHTPQRHRNIDCRRKYQCREVRIRIPLASACDWFPPDRGRGIPVVDTCTGTSCTSESECCRGRNNIP